VARNYPDWLAAYIEYASYSEAPRKMHFWSGVSAVAGALRRRVWIDQRYFRWYPNSYIVLVAPPGVVAKSTTVGIATNLLRQLPYIKFGPHVVTWPALVTAFAAAREVWEINGQVQIQCALTLESSEFGNLVNPGDREMIDLLVNLWDSRSGTFEKITKTNGSDKIENPYINLIACTTPAWIAGNFPEYVIGGGFTSRCLFVYADKKEKLIAYPALEVPPDLEEHQAKLVADLDQIANALCGPYELLPETIAWGKQWYEHHWKHKPVDLDDDRFSSYLERKQTHIHKVAMIWAAAQSNELVLRPQHLYAAAEAVTDLEKDMPKVFARIGRTEQSNQSERFIQFVQRRERVRYTEAYRYVHSAFPNFREFEQIVSGAVRSGQLMLTDVSGAPIGAGYTGEVWLMVPRLH